METVRTIIDEHDRTVPSTERRPGRCGSIDPFTETGHPCILEAGHTALVREHRSVSGSWTGERPVAQHREV